MDYLMHLRSLTREKLSFLPLSDNIEGVGYNFMNSSFMFFAKYYQNGNALWLWHEYFSRRPNIPGSTFFGKRMAGACSLSGLMDFVLFVEGTPPTPQLLPAKHFEDCGRIILRTGCQHGDLLFHFEGGPQTFEHTHSDKGEFIMEAYGERFAADPGVIKYQDPACNNYKRTPYHNLVTLKGQNQDYRDAEHAVVLSQVEFGERADYIDADLRNSYKAFTKYRRQIVFVRPNYFVILDEVQSAESGLEWNYHSCAPITGIDLATGLIRLQGAKASMILAIASAQALQASTGNYATEGVILTHNLVLTPLQPSTSLQIAALLLPFPMGEGSKPEPQVRVTKAAAALIFTVTGQWGTDEVRCGLGDSSNVVITRGLGAGKASIFNSGS